MAARNPAARAENRTVFHRDFDSGVDAGPARVLWRPRKKFYPLHQKLNCRIVWALVGELLESCRPIDKGDRGSERQTELALKPIDRSVKNQRGRCIRLERDAHGFY